MYNRRIQSAVAVALVGAFIAFTAGTSFASPAGIALGSAVGTREASMQTSFNSWMPIDGKTYPLVSGASLKSGNGNISITLKDFARIDGGKNTEFVITGTVAAGSTLTLQKGAVAFRVPRGTSLTIITPTAQVAVPVNTGSIQKVSLNSKEDRIGAILFDGKGTKVSSLGGTFSVTSVTGTSKHLLSNGSAVYVSGAEEQYTVQQVQLADEPGKLAAAGGILAAAETAGPLLWILPGLGLAGGAVAIGSSGGGGSSDIPVSPFRP